MERRGSLHKNIEQPLTRIEISVHFFPAKDTEEKEAVKKLQFRKLEI